ncbi:MAG: PDZ domain-containing protein [Deltaproteobacteria bacterium]|nr:PDZ domain-containing protein [Deltaproteobacteria bacterium]
MEKSQTLTLAGVGKRSLVFFLFLFLFCNSLNAVASEQDSGSIGTSVVPTAVGQLVVLHVIKDSPADIKGLLPGDLIVEVNGVDLRGSEFSRIVKDQLWGEAGTEIDLKYLRPGKEGLTTLRLMRTKLPDKPAKLPGVKMVLPKKNNRDTP